MTDFPNLLPGSRFRLRRSNGDDPETFTFVCLARTINLTQAKDFEDTTVNDCDNPTTPAVRKSVVRSTSWNLSFSGNVDAARMANYRADFASPDAVRYQIEVDPADGQGAGTWTGAIHFENFEQATNDRGIVTFSVTARGDGEIAWADAA